MRVQIEPIQKIAEHKTSKRTGRQKNMPQNLKLKINLRLTGSRNLHQGKTRAQDPMNTQNGALPTPKKPAIATKEAKSLERQRPAQAGTNRPHTESPNSQKERMPEIHLKNMRNPHTSKKPAMAVGEIKEIRLQRQLQADINPPAPKPTLRIRKTHMHPHTVVKNGYQNRINNTDLGYGINIRLLPLRLKQKRHR